MSDATGAPDPLPAILPMGTRSKFGNEAGGRFLGIRNKQPAYSENADDTGTWFAAHEVNWPSYYASLRPTPSQPEGKRGSDRETLPPGQRASYFSGSIYEFPNGAERIGDRWVGDVDWIAPDGERVRQNAGGLDYEGAKLMPAPDPLASHDRAVIDGVGERVEAGMKADPCAHRNVNLFTMRCDDCGMTAAQVADAKRLSVTKPADTYTAHRLSEKSDIREHGTTPLDARIAAAKAQHAADFDRPLTPPRYPTRNRGACLGVMGIGEGVRRREAKSAPGTWPSVDSGPGWED